MRVTRAALLTTVITSFLVGSVYAVDPTEYTLDPVVVTAQRSASNDLDTPATVVVKTGKELQATGATHVADALQFTEGVLLYSQNPYGQSTGRMSSEVALRGMKKGALVMVNGVPLNMNGLFQLDNIPVENVAKVEVLRGAGTVMYGSEAAGGVINIITKKELPNEVKVTVGNHGKRYYSLTSQFDKLGITVLSDELGELDGTSFGKENERTMGKSKVKIPATRSDFLQSKKFFLSANYEIDEAWHAYFAYSNDKIRKDSVVTKAVDKWKVGDVYEHMADDETTKQFMLSYEKDRFHGTAYYKKRDLDYSTLSKETYRSDNSLAQSRYGVNVTNDWLVNDTMRVVGGVTVERETYDQVARVDKKRIGDFTRQNYSLYGNLHITPNEQDTWIFGLRYDMTDMEKNQSYKKLLPQLQYNHALSDSETVYANVGRSFRVPTFTELYGNPQEPKSRQSSRFYSNADLVPEMGWIYEVGYKKNFDDASLRLALFHMDVDNHIDTDKDSKFMNYSEYKNTGLEISWQEALTDELSYSLGATLQNPKAFSEKKNRKTQAVESGWEDLYSKLQFTAGLTYRHENLTVNVNGNYVGQRANEALPTILVNVNADYKVDNRLSIYGSVHNLFDRENVTTNGSSYYYGAPRLITVGAKYKF